MASYVRQFAVLVTAVQGKDAKNAVFIGLTSTVESRPNLAAQEAPGRFFFNAKQDKCKISLYCALGLTHVDRRGIQSIHLLIY